MAMTEEQQRFLNRFLNSNGDFYGTINSMGLEYSHILSWRKNYNDFDIAFKTAKVDIINHIKEENYLKGLRELNHILKHGVVEHTITRKTLKASSNKTDCDQLFETGADVVTEVSEKWVKKGVPLAAIKEAMSDNNIARAAQTLVNEGVIPATVAKKMMLGAEKLSDVIRDSFEMNAQDDTISEKKAMALIKHAILGQDI